MPSVTHWSASGYSAVCEVSVHHCAPAVTSIAVPPGGGGGGGVLGGGMPWQRQRSEGVHGPVLRPGLNLSEFDS